MIDYDFNHSGHIKELTQDCYTASYYWDPDSQCFVALLLDVDATVYFVGEDETELREEMKDAIAAYEDFLNDLAESGGWELCRN